MKNTEDISVKSPGLLAILLTVLFVGLKVTNLINWSWIWIISPLWIDFLLSIVILFILLVIYYFKR